MRVARVCISVRDRKCLIVEYLGNVDRVESKSIANFAKTTAHGLGLLPLLNRRYLLTTTTASLLPLQRSRAIKRSSVCHRRNRESKVQSLTALILCRLSSIRSSISCSRRSGSVSADTFYEMVEVVAWWLIVSALDV